jgi:hypothetical protein
MGFYNDFHFILGKNTKKIMGSIGGNSEKPQCTLNQLAFTQFGIWGE